MGRKKSIPGVSFSWKRATGLSNAKAQREFGIPLTRAGRRRKAGNARGCCVPAAFVFTGGIAAATALPRPLLHWLRSHAYIAGEAMDQAAEQHGCLAEGQHWHP